MTKKTKKMQTSLVFGEDGTIEVHNLALGDTNDHCEKDIADIREFLEGEGVEVLTDRSLACDAPGSTAAAINTGHLDQPRTNRATAQSENYVHIHEGG